MILTIIGIMAIIVSLIYGFYKAFECWIEDDNPKPILIIGFICILAIVSAGVTASNKQEQLTNIITHDHGETK